MKLIFCNERKLNKMNDDIRKDIQYLLFMYEAYIEDISGEAWENEEFVKLANKYGFTKENLHKGLEHLGC